MTALSTQPAAAPFFGPLVHDLVERSARATVSQLTPASPSLGLHLRDLLERLPGAGSGYLAPPVVEALFEWERGDAPLEDLTLAGTPEPLLSPALIDALDGAPKEQQFPRTRYPYRHQVKAWQALRRTPARSIIVSTGTSSGKTECFLVPILDDLARQLTENEKPLVGVQAIFLYPLNALIRSQRDRLEAWTKPFGDKLRFCLYNGLTPDFVRDPEQDEHPNEVLSRKRLRESPPPVLVTNATMLEYMLVRQDDAPIIAESQGKLRWIVLDEAHTYVGSRAAEVALLLRRVLHAFGAKAEDVRFVATSATIGGADVEEGLKAYVADLAGISPDQVDVVTGKRQVPPLASYDGSVEPLPDPASLAGLDQQQLFDRLARVSSIRALRGRLTENALPLGSVASVLAGQSADTPALLNEETTRRTLALLDAASTAHDATGSLLPVRVHLFHRAQPGLWACCNPSCGGREGTALDTKDWKFGKVFLERRERCDECESLVLEAVFCKGCGAEFLVAADDGSRIVSRSWRVPDDDTGTGDETAGDDDDEEEEAAPAAADAVPAPEDDAEPSENASPAEPKTRALICGRDPAPDVETECLPHLDPKTGDHGVAGPGTVSFTLATTTDDGRARCPRCSQVERSGYELIRGVQLGAPFYLATAIPALLERLPEGDDCPALRPSRGRRLLSFTDSRQGTARFATRLQLDAERRWTRSFVYHKLWSAVKAPTVAEIAALQGAVAALQQPAQANPALKNLLESQQQELAKLQAQAACPTATIAWASLVTALEQSDTTEWIWQAHKEAYGPAGRTRLDWARTCLLRELLRRPRRQSSLETLGLAALTYPALDQVTSAPPAWLDRGLDVLAWREFLTIALDYFARAHGAVSFSADMRRWLGTPASSTRLVPPGTPGERNRTYAWPSIKKGRPPRLARLLAAGLGLNTADSDHRDLLGALLLRAWADVMAAHVFDEDDRGYYLDLEAKAHVRTVHQARLCPVTGRLLASTFQGFSPYQVGDRDNPGPTGPELEMPRLAYTFPRRVGSDVSPETVRAWLRDDPKVGALRAVGAWTELSDRIASFVDYLQASEHSAQLRAGRLRRLEDAFREGSVNVLGCSTTMEMGVDIGGLSAVVMNNAPPGPANFLQRAGRAGRRMESRAVTLTICQAVPHGEAVFRDPTWPFTTPVHVPCVSLSSRRIVQRHVQALALARYLAEEDSLRLMCRWFFLAGDGENATSAATAFKAWLHEGALADVHLIEGVERVVRRSVFAGAPLAQLLDAAVGALNEIEERWTAEREALVRELQAAGGVPKPGAKADPVQKALGAQLRRLEEEYLLRYLASEGFLPSYGFPLHVVPFVTTTAEQLASDKAAEDAGEKERDEGYDRAKSYPSRPLAVAVREFAPGSAAVLDGAVFESGGVTLNWHLPAGDKDQTREIQRLRWAFRCRACGKVGTSALRVETCPACSSAEDLVQWRCLRPAGFAVDIRERPHNDLSRQRWIPSFPPLISASGGSWTPLGNGGVARYRHDSEGTIISLSPGATRHGYAVCLRCGRAASELAPDGPLPPPMDDHDRLRGGRRDLGTAHCPGSDQTFSIVRRLWLGGEEQTDVVELQLVHPTSSAGDETAASTTTLAVAFRQALADQLGIEPEEIGWATAMTNEGGTKRRSIVLYDTAEGGAGYVARIPVAFDELAKRAREILTCPRECDSACHGCLLRFDTQRESENLDRHAGLAVLDDVFFKTLELPLELRVLGSASRFETLSLVTAWSQALERAGVAEVRVHLGGEAKDWDAGEWPLWASLRRLRALNVKVTVVLPENSLNDLYANEAALLSKRLTDLEVLVAPGNGVAAGQGWLAAEVAAGDAHVRWALVGSKAANSLVLAETWGQLVDDTVAIRASGSGPLPVLAGVRAPKQGELDKAEHGVYQELAVAKQFDGPIAGFGDRFWKAVAAKASGLSDRLGGTQRLSKVTYRDRFVRSPLTARLLNDVLRALSVFKGGIGPDTTLHVTTTFDPKKVNKFPSAFYDDWADPVMLRAVLEALLGKFGTSTKVDIPSYLIHKRELVLEWPDDVQLCVRLDHGLGFMRQLGQVSHAFQAPVQNQVASVLKAACLVVNNEPGAPIYVQGLVKN